MHIHPFHHAVIGVRNVLHRLLYRDPVCCHMKPDVLILGRAGDLDFHLADKNDRRDDDRH